MKLTIDTQTYNQYKYGKPYIATMDFKTAKGEPTWGEWVGQPGTAGMLVCECKPGDVVMSGQRNKKNMRHSAPGYYIVQDDMSIAACSKLNAYKTWQNK